MIHNSIIVESDGAIFGKFTVNELSNVINISVSKLCTNVVVFLLDGKISSTEFSSDTYYTICACSPFLLDSGTNYFHGAKLSKGYFDPETYETDDGAVSVSKTVQSVTFMPIRFTESNIQIAAQKKFAIGTYGFVAW